MARPRPPLSELYDAVQRNSTAEVQLLCQQLASECDPGEKKKCLDFVDGSGFTPLLVAASRNYLQIARLVRGVPRGLYVCSNHQA